jgi:NAD-dependent DNA ligase
MQSIGEVTKLFFKITQHGNLYPILKVKVQGVEQLIPLPNIWMLQKKGVWEGDFLLMDIGVDGVLNDWIVDKNARAADVTPPELPIKCPCCVSNLHYYPERRLVVKCENKSKCKAQQMG